VYYLVIPLTKLCIFVVFFMLAVSAVLL